MEQKKENNFLKKMGSIFSASPRGQRKNLKGGMVDYLYIPKENFGKVKKSRRYIIAD
jgi:hypothetical protein